MPLINTTPGANDANDGVLTRNPERIGNRRWGTKVFLSGTEVAIAIQEPVYQWATFESITVSTTALGLTAALKEDADLALVTVESQAVRYRLDGLAPTATVGHNLDVGAVLELEGHWEIDQFQAIRRDGVDATLRVSYSTKRYA